MWFKALAQQSVVSATGMLWGFLADVSQDSSQPFRFLDLPPELRNRKYECHFTSWTQIGLPGCPLGPHEKSNPQPAITRTCRQLRREALPVFYHASNFGVRLTIHNLLRLTEHLDTLGSTGIKSIECLKLRLIVNLWFACADGLRHFVRWAVLTKMVVSFRVVETSSIGLGNGVRIIGGAFDLIAALREGGLSAVGDIDTAFDKWLVQNDWECSCHDAMLLHFGHCSRRDCMA